MQNRAASMPANPGFAELNAFILKKQRLMSLTPKDPGTIITVS
jgi:hypothetical protein